MNYSELAEHMTKEEREFVEQALAKQRAIWSPLPGPQTQAYESDADIIGYGGAAGGGKTDLACGKALTKHKKVMILRRESTQLTGIIDRFEEIIGNKDGFNGSKLIWRLGDGHQIEFGSVPHLGDETKYQGRPHDLLVFDETSNFLEPQVRFLLGWLRSTNPDQRCQALFAFNPPTSSDGRWIINFFAPWLDKKHPNPARPGELRWFATVAGEDIEVPDNRPFILAPNNDLIYDFDADEANPADIIKPMSRTFIPSRVVDNPYLHGTGYMRQLQALPEPLRSQMLNGDFSAGLGEDPWQVIPTAWVDEATERWSKPPRKPEMDSLGVDVARGGKDYTVIARRHDWYFDELLVYPGSETPDGPSVAGLVMAASRDSAPQHVEINGVGVSVVDFLVDSNQPVIGVDVSAGATRTDKSGLLRMANERTSMWWALREALDPNNEVKYAIPPDAKLCAELTTPQFQIKGGKIYVESREEIIKRVGNSPDRATALCLALKDTEKPAKLQKIAGTGYPRRPARTNHNPYHKEESFGGHDSDINSYNPYDKL